MSNKSFKMAQGVQAVTEAPQSKPARKGRDPDAAALARRSMPNRYTTDTLRL
jgi:hypothetical protein